MKSKNSTIRGLWEKDFSRLISLLKKSKPNAPLIVIVSVEDQLVEEEIIGLLRRELASDLRLAEFGFERFNASIRTYLQRYAPPDTQVVLARALERLPDQARHAALRNLNRERDVLRQFGCSLVIFLPRDAVSEFVRRAGDFWDCRSGFFEFQEPERERSRARILEQRRAYMRLVMQRFATLKLHGILPATVSPQADIEQVFVDPSIIVRREGPNNLVESPLEPEDLLFRKLLKREQRLVVLGPPGAGKSILLRYIAVVLAQGPIVAGQRLGVDPEIDWFPTLLPLSAYATALQEEPDLSLSDYLASYLHSREFGEREQLAQLLRQEFQAGRCAVLLDGLDEIPSVGRRLEVVERIHDLAQRFPYNTYIVTSRVAGYERAPVRTPFSTLTIAPLAWAQRQKLVRNWYRVAVSGPDEAAQLANELLAMIEREEYLTSLATSPLLLTILIHIYVRGQYLPDRRGELYRVATAALTETWSLTRSVSGRPVLTHLDERILDERRIVELLGPVAFWLHQAHPDGLVSRHELTRQLVDHLTRQEGMADDRAWRIAEEFVSIIQERSGLLVEQQMEHFTFLHRTFEEYLAARYLATRRDVNRQALALLPDPNWEEVLVLVGDVLQGEYFDDYVRSLLGADAPPDVAGQNILLAGRCLNSAGRHLTETALGQEVLHKLAALVENQEIIFERRLAGGEILGELGDPRVQNTIEIPGGPFVMGVSEAELAAHPEPGPLRRLLERSAPAHQVNVPAFYIDRYPITHAQYHLFIEDKGYEREELWSQAGWAWLSQQSRKLPAYWEEYRWNRPNYPVVGVSWYEAEAYARWTGKRLPTEAEWEKAARGAGERRWPWGNEWEEQVANVEAELGQLTPVGIYPKGASPYDVLDMAGNVWEWTADWFAPYSDPDRQNTQLKVLRGGSWNTSRDHVRCTSRILSEPGARVGSVGFRCVRTPASDQE